MMHDVLIPYEVYPDVRLEMRNTDLSFLPFCPRTLLGPSSLSYFPVVPRLSRRPADRFVA
jgi:hypothetical protein